MAASNVIDQYNLYITGEKFYVEPVESPDRQCLVIDRISQEITLQRSDDVPVNSERKKLFGIVGVIQLIAGPYLLVITEARRVGTLNGHNIWEVSETECIPYSKTTLHLTEDKVRENRRYLEMVKNVLRTEGFFFSYTFDLTHSLQRLQNTTPDFPQMPMHESSRLRHGRPSRESANGKKGVHDKVPLTVPGVGLQSRNEDLHCGAAFQNIIRHQHNPLINIEIYPKVRSRTVVMDCGITICRAVMLRFISNEPTDLAKLRI